MKWKRWLAPETVYRILKSSTNQDHEAAHRLALVSMAVCSYGRRVLAHVDDRLSVSLPRLTADGHFETAVLLHCC